MPRDQAQTLFERIGGEETVASLVDAFYARVLSDPELAAFFENTSMNKLRHMQREFFAAALGGPIRYTGRSLSEAHYGRGITVQHLRRFVDHLLATLRAFDLAEEDVYEIATRIDTYADEVLGQATVDG